jgi:Mg2+ and Co2+ transporter CorA
MSDQKEALEKAMQELDDVEKSIQGEEESELDALTKALEEEIGEDLSKSDDAADEDLAKSEDEEEDEKDEDDDDMDKSDMSDFDDELVKASEGYADLTKSVEEGIGGVLDELDAMKKSMAALMNLNIKQAKVIAELVKSRKDDVAAITDMAKSIGAAPMAPGKAVFGVGGAQEQKIEKSASEITMDLTKAVQDGRVEARFLSIYGTHKDVDRLPESVRKEIGL